MQNIIKELLSSPKCNDIDLLHSQTTILNPVQEVQKGKLLISGCIDWNSPLAKNAQGLDKLHLIDQSSPIVKIFSSSNAFHFFVLLQNGSVLGMGYIQY
jgi:hypothetical protein